MTTRPDAPTGMGRPDSKVAGPSSPSALKRKADELEERAAGAEPGEEKHGSKETKRAAKRRRKGKKKKDNGPKGDNEHRDGKAISEEATGGVEETLGERAQANCLGGGAVHGSKPTNSDTSPLKPEKEERKGEKRRGKKRGKKRGKTSKRDQMRKRSDHETPDDQPNGKKTNTKNSSDEEGSEKDEKKSIASPSPQPPTHSEKHHTTPPPTKPVTTPKSLLKKSNNKTPTPHTKTVTFADDAKSADNDSIANTLRSPGGIGGKSNIPRLPGSPQPHPALLEEQSSSSPTTQQGTLPHSPDPSEDRSQEQNTKPQIAYLLNYYQARSSWKFSKTKQNWIIRNIWNLEEFSAEVSQSALWAYVNGLVAQGPKDRLLAEAKEVAKTRREELGAVQAEDDPKYRRAKLVLTALGDDDIPSDDEGDDAGGMGSDSEEDVE
ncbi:unnamed protein product [Tuber aestivum]|uniref:WKF domain-containing protein n=1 Tax=Tuber aestivum TaxID=59557 RepID=A0A292Q8K6_9PEZI|nr:unnamed protein product [Tuber aestivum]